MANSDKYLVIFYCASAGQNGPDLGSDEEEIVLLVYWVIDLHSNQVGFDGDDADHFSSTDRMRKHPSEVDTHFLLLQFASRGFNFFVWF